MNPLLIKVTPFFRNPDLFAHLREEVLPGLVEQARKGDRQLRIRSAGCATGEEAYTLAIMLSELLGSEAALADVRIFATDIDREAVNFARRGVYPAGALSGISEEQRERYFVEEDGHYEVKKPVQGMIVFGEHDLARRSPFPRILIYFTAELQRRALELFAFSLRNGGYLVLGKAETASTRTSRPTAGTWRYNASGTNSRRPASGRAGSGPRNASGSRCSRPPANGSPTPCAPGWTSDSASSAAWTRSTP